MRALVLAIIVGFVGLGTLLPAVAQADDREEARREFAAGQAADRRKEYQVAIEHYLRANDLVPHPFAMFNIATDYERLGKLREAANWYERYLDTSTTGEADREKVNRLLIELRNRPAAVTVSSRPDGARVEINGIPAGSTPYRGQLKGGMYRIAVEKDGRREWKEVTIEYGEPVTVEITLPGARPGDVPVAPRHQPPAAGAAVGSIYVTAEPAGALVLIDGRTAGVVPISVPIETGAHTIRVTAFGHLPFETPVQVIENTVTPVHAVLGRSGAMGTHPKLPFGYLVGGGGGADVKGEGLVLLFEGGLRVAQYDASLRVGRIGDATAVDILVRWAMSKAKIAPFVGAGYAYASSGVGYLLVGGLRWDLSRGDKLGFSLMAESGFRFYTNTDAGTGTSTDEASGTIVPIMASLLVMYR